MSLPRGEGAWWRSAGSGRKWVAPSSTLGTGERAFPQREIGRHAQNGGNAYSDLAQSVGATGQYATVATAATAQGNGNGNGLVHDAGVDSLIDGVLGGGIATATVVETTTDTITDAPRRPLNWPPHPGQRRPAPEPPARKGGSAGRLGRLKPGATRTGHWTYNGLRPRTRVIAVALVVAGLVAAGVATMRALAASASTNFPGVLAAQTPLQLNFPQTAVLEHIYVSVGQTVTAGQPLASEQSNVVAAQVVSDRTTLAADEQNLAQLLGTVGKNEASAAAQAYTKAQQQAVTSEQHGSQNIVDDQAIIANQSLVLAAEQADLNNAQTLYNTKCSKGLGTTDCASLSARVQADQARVTATSGQISNAQSRLAQATSLDKTLTGLASQEQQTAQLNKSFFNSTQLVDITNTRDRIAQGEFALTRDEQALQNTELTSPVTGKVTGINAATGDIVGLNTGVRNAGPGAVVPGSGNPNAGPTAIPTGTSTSGLITIQESPGLEAVMQVPESTILSIKQGEAATISVDALGGQSLPGHVTLVDPQGYTSAGQTYYNVYIVPNINTTWPAELLPQMPINVKIGG